MWTDEASYKQGTPWPDSKAGNTRVLACYEIGQLDGGAIDDQGPSRGDAVEFVGNSVTPIRRSCKALRRQTCVS